MPVATMTVLFWQIHPGSILDIKRTGEPGNDGSSELVYDLGRYATRSAIERRVGRVL